MDEIQSCGLGEAAEGKYPADGAVHCRTVREDSLGVRIVLHERSISCQEPDTGARTDIASPIFGNEDRRCDYAYERQDPPGNAFLVHGKNRYSGNVAASSGCAR